MVADTRESGVGNNTIITAFCPVVVRAIHAWPGPPLASLYNSRDEKVFDSELVTDRLVLDQQLQNTISV